MRFLNSFFYLVERVRQRLELPADLGHLLVRFRRQRFVLLDLAVRLFAEFCRFLDAFFHGVHRLLERLVQRFDVARRGVVEAPRAAIPRVDVGENEQKGEVSQRGQPRVQAFHGGTPIWVERND
jgi:hypothetical protein